MEYSEQYSVYIYPIFGIQNGTQVLRISVSAEVKVIRDKVISLDLSQWLFARFVLLWVILLGLEFVWGLFFC